MSNRGKNIIVASIAFAAIGIILYFIREWDRDVMATIRRGGYEYDTTAFRPTPEEVRVAKQFSDTVLPRLKQLGLIKEYLRTDIETIVTVSGALWYNRSAFFKESLLQQIFIYNSVNSFAVQTKVLDQETSRLVAEIIPPDKRTVYE